MLWGSPLTATRTIDKGHHRHVPQIRARGTKPWDWHRSVPNYSLASNPLIKKMRPDLNLAPTEGDRSPRKKNNTLPSLLIALSPRSLNHIHWPCKLRYKGTQLRSVKVKSASILQEHFLSKKVFPRGHCKYGECQ